MANQKRKTQQEQQDITKSSKWGNVLSGVIFLLTVLFILGFFWQSIMSFLLLE
jgi:hypothetical protein